MPKEIKWIDGIEDPFIREIAQERFEKKKTWRQVAISVGGGNTEDSVRKAYVRYIRKKKE